MQLIGQDIVAIAVPVPLLFEHQDEMMKLQWDHSLYCPLAHHQQDGMIVQHMMLIYSQRPS